MGSAEPIHADPAGVRPTLEPLPRALTLFRRFDADGVRHCHYKSNEHLLEGLAGVTDLDILIERGQARLAQESLQGAGFKRFQARLAAAHPSVEDYLGFDEASGRLIHAHVYYALVVGEKHLKNYQLALDGALLESRVTDAATGVATSEPAHELLLLVLRYALKARLRDLVLEPLGRPCFDADARREHAWLVSRLDADRLHRITSEHFGEPAAAMIGDLAREPPSIWRLRAFRRRIATALARQRSHGVLESIPLRLFREFSWWMSGLNRRVLHLPVPLHRTHPAGGRIFALLGADGSGKSTVARDLRRWLAWKLDVYPVYFGSGDGPSSLLRWPLKLALRLRGARSRAAPAPRTDTGVGRGIGGGVDDVADQVGDEGAATGSGETQALSAARVVWALLLAREKRAKMRACVKARHRGMLVVADRYPQVQFPGFNDGPLLTSWIRSRAGWKRALASWEFEVYRRLALEVPDLVLKLDVTPEAGMARSPDSSPADVEQKREAVRAIEYGPGSRSVVVDAMRPLEAVLLDVRRAVWEQL
ncbi:MAG: nucleoside/nucleotide kinase family protein [Planctomycetota bacterium]